MADGVEEASPPVSNGAQVLVAEAFDHAAYDARSCVAMVEYLKH